MADEKVPGIPGIGSLRLVRRGDYSTLYNGIQLRFNREVAVKVFAGRMEDSRAVSRFERECAAMGRLSHHPHVVTVFDSGIVKKQPYLVTEWLPAGSVNDRLAAGDAFDWRDAVDFGVKLAGALETAHRADVLHRNLKPHNVFLSAFGDPLLGDFEIGSDGSSLSRSGDTRDNRIHAAPEMVGDSRATRATEVYALSSIVFTLLRGRPPYEQSDDEPLVRVMARRATEPPPDLRPIGVPLGVSAVLERGLSRDPAGRPATTQELGRLLQAAQRAAGQPMTRLFVFPETEEDRALPLPVLPPGLVRADEAPSPAEAASAPAPAPASAPAARTAAPAPAPGTPLLEQVRTLLRDAMDLYRDRAAITRLSDVEARLDDPLRVAIAGRVKAGKSTLLNGLVGEELAPTDAGECTKVVVWYTDGITYRATLHPRGADPVHTALSRQRGAIEVDFTGYEAKDIDRVVVEWPSSSLATMTIIDTPGIASINEEVSQRAHDFLTPDDERDSPADAVLYLMRHVHPTDVRFLEAFHDEGAMDHASPINAIGVLSRADEVGVGRPDALVSAARIAKRYRSDPKVRRLCQTVVPVAGLLAQAGAALREDEFRALEKLSHLPSLITEELLVSADRFVSTRTPADLSRAEHEHLLERFGLYGVRLAIRLIKEGTASTAGRLSTELVARSGLEELRELLMTQFASRRDVLKARTALTVLEAVLREDPVDGSENLSFVLERVNAGAHEFAEIRLLGAHRSGGVRFRASEVEEVDRLLGVEGPSPAARLGLPPDAGEEAIREALLETIGRWQRRCESPMSSREVADAAQVLVRSCEGMLLALGTPR